MPLDGVAFSQLGSENSVMSGAWVCRDLKIEDLTNVSVHFRMTKLKGFIR